MVKQYYPYEHKNGANHHDVSDNGRIMQSDQVATYPSLVVVRVKRSV